MMRLLGLRALQLMAAAAQAQLVAMLIWAGAGAYVLFGTEHGLAPILVLALLGAAWAVCGGLWWALADESLLRHDVARRSPVGLFGLSGLAVATLVLVAASYWMQPGVWTASLMLLPAALAQAAVASSAWSVWMQCRYNIRRRRFFLENWSGALSTVEQAYGAASPRTHAFLASQSGDLAYVRPFVADLVADADSAHADGLHRAVAATPLKAYDFQGLRAAPFHDPADYPWIAELMTHFDEIRAEVMNVLANDDVLAPYPLIGLDAWKALDLYKGGVRVAQGCDACPLTASLVERIVPGGPVREVIISKLEPHGRLPPHIDNTLPMLTLHLPLRAPPASGIRVGNELKAWRTGEPVVIDTTFEHEAWNDASEARINLMIDFWPDGLEASEKAFFTEVYRRQMRPHLKA